MRMNLAFVVLGLLVWTGRVDAYPQFQLSTGNDTCKQCHFSPAGGGLITEYGRDEAGSTISWKEGNGGFLHGAWTPPASLQLGADFRFAGGYKTRPTPGSGAEAISEPIYFPMQMELYVRPKIGPVSMYVNAGLRPYRESGVAPGSREHYLMYENEDGGWYVRAGRFFPVYGIRSQDHTGYTRRHLQMYIYEEPYGASWGMFDTGSELHVSAFVRSPDILGTARDNGVAAYYERRNEDATAAYAAQTKLTFSDTDRRGWIGGVYKRWLDGPGLMLLGELDLGVQAFRFSNAAPIAQAVGYVGVTYMKIQGLMLGGAIQVSDPDITLRDSSDQAVEANVQWFPIPHVELHLLTRVETQALEVGDPTLLVLGQLHYYL